MSEQERATAVNIFEMIRKEDAEGKSAIAAIMAAYDAGKRAGEKKAAE